MNILFVCSRNQWRSPTAERLWQRASGISVRSAGTSNSARRRLNANDLHWADLILVMEEEHSARIKQDFREDARGKAIHVLDIPDQYGFMDPDLVVLLEDRVTPILGET